MSDTSQKCRLAPGFSNIDGYKSLHLIHEDLKMYRMFRLMATTFVKQESAALGGDQRLYADSLGKGTLALPYCTQAALDAILEWIEFNGLDAEITIRHWNGREFKDYNANLQYLPPADQESNSCEVFNVEFTLINMREIA